MDCPSCSAPVPDNARFCPACGSAQPIRPEPVEGQDPADPTRTSAEVAGGPGPARPELAEGPDTGRFQPGTIFADRYRIVGLLGRGGMGEVYRADDLKLGRTVALKFLPEALERDPARLVRFYNEVRTALRVTHPNVCRVYDVGESAGSHYLSMEFVDGEDLATLLRKIGRLPEDRAVKMARQLCAGLAAAHAQGVLHRDLKPANVLIDGRGEVKITDFGLAGAAGTFAEHDLRAGTPAYMSPEQLAGSEVTVRSDLYALGLVLYEIFSGKPAFEGQTRDEIVRQRTETTPTSLASVVGGLDPAVAKIVDRCLSTDPAGRPASATAIAAALPGGDPLAEAIAAGQTPSPEMVAEAGVSGGLKPGVAVALVAAILVLLAGVAFISPRIVLHSSIDLDLSPPILANEAAKIVRQTGWGENTRDRLYTWHPNQPYYEHVRDGGTGTERWEEFGAFPPSGMLFAYRESPDLLIRLDQGSVGSWMLDPPPTEPGMVEVWLDPAGRLVSFTAVPERSADPEAVLGEVEDPRRADYDFTPLLTAAGLDPATLTPAEPLRIPPSFADRRYAWTGPNPDRPDLEIRVEAASLEGRPVFFRIVEPWDRPFTVEGALPGFWPMVGEAIYLLWFVVVFVGAGLVAIRNVRLGRGDFRTAFRFALYLAVGRMLWMVAAHHHASVDEVMLLIYHIAWAAYRFVMVYIFYLALEPYARRLWPEMLVSWVRIFDGRLRDPRVGRDILIGIAAGCLYTLIASVGMLTPQWLDLPDYGLASGFWSTEALRGIGSAFGSLIGPHTIAVLECFFGLMMFLIVRVVIRSTWVAVLVMSGLVAFMYYPGTGTPWPYFASVAILLVIYWTVLFRAGILPLMILWSVYALLGGVRVTDELTAWHALPMWLTYGAIAAVTVWGFKAAVAGRPLFRDEIQEGMR